MHDAVVSKLIAASRGSPCDSMASCYVGLQEVARLASVAAAGTPGSRGLAESGDYGV